jgi:diguanylate cyclase (GGDEF)-like protein
MTTTTDSRGHEAMFALAPVSLWLEDYSAVKAVGEEVTAARIGGDQFCVLLPATDERGSEQLMERIDSLVDLNNQYYQGARLSLSIGAATCSREGRLEQTMSEADERMYAAKREYYGSAGRTRRRHDH